MRKLARRLLLSAVTDRQGGASATGVRHWLRYNAFGVDMPPIQHLDHLAPIAQKLEAEARLMDFIVWLVVSKPCGRTISPETARKYVGQVVAWMRRVHSADFAGGLDLHNLKDLVKGMRRELGERKKRVRWGVRTQQLRQAMDANIPRAASRDAQAWRATLATAFCGLLRGAEVGLPDGESFNALKHLKRADIRFVWDDGVLTVLLRVHARKGKMLTGKHNTVYLRSGGTLIDPVIELLRMVQMDPVPKDQESSTPLFRSARGAAFTRRDVAAMVKALMKSIGLDPAMFGAHSLRIGGATAALAAGVSPTLIRISWRWASDVYEIYCRLSRQAAAGVSVTVGSTPFTDAERGEFESEEFEALPSELAALGDVDFGPASDDDASDDEVA